MQPKYFYEVIV